MSEAEQVDTPGSSGQSVFDVESACRPYHDPTSFIVGTTREIWDDAGMGRIRTYYAADSIVHTAYGATLGSEAVVAASLRTLAAFPERAIVANDVVWEERGPATFVSCHRIGTLGVNAAPTVYGPTTNHNVRRLSLANCVVREGVYIEEWLVRDELSIVQQLGYDPFVTAEQVAERSGETLWEIGAEGAVDPLQFGDETVSGRRPRPRTQAEEAVLTMLEEVWNQKLMNALPRYVDPDIVLQTTRGRLSMGLHDYRTALVELFGMLPDAQIRVLDMASSVGPDRPPRVAVVWALSGSYQGPGTWGRGYSTRPLSILGTSHFTFLGRRIAVDVTVFDELAAMAQVALAPTSGPAAGGEPVARPEERLA